jgi:hypothetical protein
MHHSCLLRTTTPDRNETLARWAFLIGQTEMGLASLDLAILLTAVSRSDVALQLEGPEVHRVTSTGMEPSEHKVSPESGKTPRI